MFRPSSPPPRDTENEWRFQLDQFVEENQKQLSALFWGILQEWGTSNDTLGIDLKPKPHFVACSRTAIEKLNRNVSNQLREILGILDGYNPEQEVVMIGIGNGQIKLINFQPDLPPPVCFEEVEADLDTLIEQLEARLAEQIVTN